MSTNSRKPAQTGATSAQGENVLANFRPRADRLASGKVLRKTVSRERHAEWKPPAKRRDPVDFLQESNRDRLPQRVPVRFGRMLRSAFTFLRGSAALMA